jgi:hypothetical protein
VERYKSKRYKSTNEVKPRPKLKRQNFGANESGSNGVKRFGVIVLYWALTQISCDFMCEVGKVLLKVLPTVWWFPFNLEQMLRLRCRE